MSKKRKTLIIVGSILVVLIGIRIYLPFWITDYVNKVLDDVEGYNGKIEDVDLNLYRGAYVIHELKMEKTGGKVPVPFLDIEKIDLSVQWEALLDGRIVGEVKLIKPAVNFVGSKDTTNAQSGTEADWTEPIKELIPLKINRFLVVNGTVFYKDFSTEPAVNIFLKDFYFEAKNLENTNSEAGQLPSTITATANSIGDGKMQVDCKANLLKSMPDFDMDFKFEGMNLTALNDFTQAYAHLDFEKGTMDIYNETAMYDGKIDGYVKPILTDLKVFSLKEKDGILQALWESFAGSVIFIFKNHSKNQFATKVPFEGTIDNTKTKIWPTLGNILKNAFISAFDKKTDDSVSFQDVKKTKTEEK